MFRLSKTLSRKNIILALAAIIVGIITAICLTISKSENNIVQNNKEDPPIKIEETLVPQEITKFLEENNLTLLSKDDSKDEEKWLQNWNRFKEKFKQTELGWAWKFTDWSSLKNNVNVPKKFKTKCISNSRRKVNSVKQQLYKDIVDYCTNKNS